MCVSLQLKVFSGQLTEAAIINMDSQWKYNISTFNVKKKVILVAFTILDYRAIAAIFDQSASPICVI